MSKVKTIISTILILVAVIIALQNIDEVETHLLFTSVKMPRVALILSVFALGFIAGKLITFRRVKAVVSKK